MKYFIRSLFLLNILMFGLGNQANSFESLSKRTPLNKETIEKVISIANGSPLKLKDNDYFEGWKIEKYQDFGNYYWVNYYLFSPTENFPGVIRLTEFNVGIGEKSLNSKSCYSQNDQECRFNWNNLVSIAPQRPEKINSESLKSFVNLRANDFDDATLAYLLRIIRIPVKDIINKSHEEFNVRDYQVTNELYDDIKSYPIHDVDNQYLPRTISLTINRSNSDREFKIEFRQEDSPYSMPLTLFVTKLDIEGNKTKIRIVDGPVP